MIEYRKSMICVGELISKDKELDKSTFRINYLDEQFDRSIKDYMLQSNLKIGDKTYLKINMDEGKNKQILGHLPKYSGEINIVKEYK